MASPPKGPASMSVSSSTWEEPASGQMMGVSAYWSRRMIIFWLGCARMVQGSGRAFAAARSRVAKAALPLENSTVPEKPPARMASVMACRERVVLAVPKKRSPSPSMVSMESVGGMPCSRKRISSFAATATVPMETVPSGVTVPLPVRASRVRSFRVISPSTTRPGRGAAACRSMPSWVEVGASKVRETVFCASPTTEQPLRTVRPRWPRG